MPEFESYDLIVAGGGTAGCLIAARIAENGINPRTGDRLRVALFEGGPYFLDAREAPRPGYGAASRRSAVVNISYAEFRPEPWPYDGLQNKMLGGCGLHWGGNAYLPLEEDYDHWRRETGVDWSAESFRDAVDEITRVYNIHPSVEENMTLGNRLFRNAARALGYEPERVTMARRNCINCGYCGGGHLCKYDAKGSSLYYMHLAESNGVHIVTDAEVDKVLIERRRGRPVAGGIHYTRHGRRMEARAPKVLVTCGTAGTPVLLLRSGYGPRDVLGPQLLVENANVGRHLDGDINYMVDALFDTEIKETRGGVERYSFRVNHGEQGYHNLNIYDSNMSAVDGAYPHILALHEFAPEFGWEHKAYMKTACRRFGGINVALGAPLWDKGTVTPAGRFEYDRTNPQVLKRLREGAELVVELYKHMDVRPVKIGAANPTSYRVSHETSSCRAGESAADSVVNSDFESHDIENLFVASAAVIPRGNLSLSHIPTCVVAAHAWRRIVANHFSRGA